MWFHWGLCKDCEGFGSIDSDKTRDAKLMSLCALSLGLVQLPGFNEGLQDYTQDFVDLGPCQPR